MKKKVITAISIIIVTMACNKEASIKPLIEPPVSSAVQSEVYKDALQYNLIIFNSARKNSSEETSTARTYEDLATKIEAELLDSIGVVKGEAIKNEYYAYKNSNAYSNVEKNQQILISKFAKSLKTSRITSDNDILTEINGIASEMIDSTSTSSIQAKFSKQLNSKLIEITLKYSADTAKGIDIAKYKEEIVSAVSLIVSDINSSQLSKEEKETLSNLCYASLATIINNVNLTSGGGPTMRVTGFWNTFTKVIATVAAVVVTVGAIAGGSLIAGPVGTVVGAVMGVNMGNNIGRQVYCSQAPRVPKCSACENNLKNTVGGLVLIWAKC
ncbi:MAG: hypothetical protein ACKVOU_08120 [Cytophagales bacterium]